MRLIKKYQEPATGGRLRSLAKGGRLKAKNGEETEDSQQMITTGGAGYIPSVDGTAIVNTLSNLWGYAKSYIKNKVLDSGDDVVVNLSNRNVSRINNDTENVETILANEFEERNNNTVRKKKDFVNTTDTLLGDRKIPLSNISTFYGIENGKLKAGPIDVFDDETVIIPNRAKTVGRVKEFHASSKEDSDIQKRYREKVDSEIAKYNKEHGYEVPWYTSLIKGPYSILRSEEGRVRAKQVKDSIKAANRSLLNDYRGDYVVTENNDTINNYKLNMPKALFADENGNAVFVSDLRRSEEELNSYLSKHPMYPIMVDNGRYASSMVDSPNYGMYVGLGNPYKMFVIGTTKPLNGQRPLVGMAMGGRFRR